MIVKSAKLLAIISSIMALQDILNEKENKSLYRNPGQKYRRTAMPNATITLPAILGIFLSCIVFIK